MALNKEGKVYAFGSNNFGYLGFGDINKRNTPTLIPNLYNIIQITTGYYHSLALDKEGKVYSFGLNNSGQLGLIESSFTPIMIQHPKKIVSISAGARHSLVLDIEGKFYVFGELFK